MTVSRFTLGGPEGAEHIEHLDTAAQGGIPNTGVTVRSGPAQFSKEVRSVADISDDDIVNIDGMDIQAGMARQMGLLDSMFDGQPTSNDLARQATHEAQQALSDEGGEAEGDEGEPMALFEEAMDNLNKVIDAGDMNLEEGQAYEQVIGQVALEGETVTDVIEVIEGLHYGEIEPSDVPANSMDMLQRAEAQVTDAATQAVIAELGQEGLDELQMYVDRNPHAEAEVRDYAIARAVGNQDGVTWGDLLDQFRENF